MQSLNQVIFYSINTYAGHHVVLDDLMLFVTHYLPYVMIVCVAVYMVRLYPAYHRGIRSGLDRLIQVTEFFCTLGVTALVVQIIKLVAAVPRPFLTLIDTVLLVPDQGGYSFPSMHTALTTAVAISVLVHHRRLGLLLLLFALLVGVSRVFVGVHYPVDVLVGALLGAGISLMVHLLFSAISRHTDA
jgi:undecaprenyl-diphosphatase